MNSRNHSVRFQELGSSGRRVQIGELKGIVGISVWVMKDNL